MAGKRTEFNNEKNRNLKKILLIALSVIAVLAVATVILLFNMNGIYCKLGKEKLEKNSFTDAKIYFDKCSNDEGELLGKYVNLRIEMNKKYPELLSEYDAELISKWVIAAAQVVEGKDALPESVGVDAIGVYSSLKAISDGYDKYTSLQGDILELMDVFSEFNRLYTKDSNGKNTVFTLVEENGKIERWERLYAELEKFRSAYVPEDNVYLLGYLIKEAHGECEDLKKAMAVVADAGYGETANVRLSGEGTKTFPGVTNNSGDTVSVSRKEEYEGFLNKNIQRALIENGISQYYTGY